jgi:drug/metabolite transporter (DMT)-like permease
MSFLRRREINNSKLIFLTLITLLCFAGNSLLCRLALRENAIDPGLFTLIRIFSGIVVLNLIVLGKFKRIQIGGVWKSGLALFIYAAAFSWAYVQLPAGTGALILFGCVQGTMLLAGYAKGERLSTIQISGCAIAVAGLVVLVFPGLSAPEPLNGLLMALAGIGWGAYSLFGKGSKNPLADTAGNFVRAFPYCLFLLFAFSGALHASAYGILLAVVSGAVTSGLGYALWYQVLPNLSVSRASIVQLSVPMIATLGGVVLLGEEFTLRVAASSVLILAGIGLAVVKKSSAR